MKGGTQNFRSPGRIDPLANSQALNIPGPSDYAPDNSPIKKIPKEAGKKRPFGTNIKRFGNDDNGVPGAGKYDHKADIGIKNPK